MRSLPFWPSEKQAGKPLHPAMLHAPKKCRQCGYSFLFWHKHEGKWRLHHYALLEGDAEPKFVLHRCGFDSAGKPRATPETDSAGDGSPKLSTEENVNEEASQAEAPSSAND